MNILVLCTGNSCRSQIAEGYLRCFTKGNIKVYSAGIEIHGVNSNAIKTMAADGVDISAHTSNHIDEYNGIEFDFVITVCDHAQEVCPFFSTEAIKLHQNFPDPANVKGDEIEIVMAFEKVRDMIKIYCKNFVSDYLKL